MNKRSGQLIFSPSDLNTFFESPYASWMDRYHLEFPDAVMPDPPAAEKKLVAHVGLVHERRRLEALKQGGEDVFEGSARGSFETTFEAMRSGRAVLYQASLRRGLFAGYADLLYRVDRPSTLGAWSYEVGDIKLARKPKPYVLLQLCAYAKMLEHIQGVRPANIHVVNGDGAQVTLRTDDFFFYFLALERDFLSLHRGFDPTNCPMPAARANHGRWTSHAMALLEHRDDLSRVAGITTHQVRRFTEAGVTTLTELAACTKPRVPRMEQPIFERLRSQARLQRESAGRAKLLYEIVPPDPAVERSGLALLPPESPGDIYFDMEGYPLTEGGLEYLFGATYAEGSKLEYKDFWAHDRDGERRAFEGFIDWVHARWRSDPLMHIYHYAPYEVSALRRLMGQHGTREREVDDLLRAEVFVDLYRIVRQAVRIGDSSYSLKKVEHLYRPSRTGDVATATQSIVEYGRWLDTKDGTTWESSPILRGIRDYNREDCESTRELRLWLSERQTEAGVVYVRKGDDEEPARLAGPSDSEALAQRLLAAIPADRSADPERWRIQELLAALVGFHRREAKPIWWAMYDREGKHHDELVEDPDCLGALVRTDTAPVADKRSLLYEYRLDPNQETSLTEGSECYVVQGLGPTTIAKLDLEAGLLLIKLGKKREEPASVISLIPSEFVDATKIETAIRSVAETWERRGTLPGALETLLRRTVPRIAGIVPRAPVLGGGRADDRSVTQSIAGLQESALAIQGPPGSGKTRVASAAILELAMRGYRIGVSSNSHKAIQKLIEEVQKRARARSATVGVTKVTSNKEDEVVAQGLATRAASMKDVDFATAQVVGGTAWAFSDPAAAGRFDYLFVDEAGQVSIANVVGMSPCAKNLVLLGDQMQLGQPVQGSHPGESGLSALQYLLAGHRTIPEELGIFLGTTWRLHPNLCRLISGAIYEDKLLPEPGTESRVLRLGSSAANDVCRESGVVFVPVSGPSGKQKDAEITKISTIVAELRGRKLTAKRQAGGESGVVNDAEDVLIVAPYNVQVRKLRAALPEARVGTVDKFQGQEAPIVILSMSASAGEELTRRLEFLFSPNRLNVALSRAQSVAIVVGDPALTRTHVTSAEQMRLVNLFCRIVEEGSNDRQRNPELSASPTAIAA